jgi:hypothetical protein
VLDLTGQGLADLANGHHAKQSSKQNGCIISLPTATFQLKPKGMLDLLQGLDLRDCEIIAPQFQKHLINDRETALLLSDEDWKQMGIPIGVKIRFKTLLK